LFWKNVEERSQIRASGDSCKVNTEANLAEIVMDSTGKEKNGKASFYKRKDKPEYSREAGHFFNS